MKTLFLNNSVIAFFGKLRLLCLIAAVIVLFFPGFCFPQSLNDSSSVPDDVGNSKFLSPEKFTYAGERRYTLDGLLPNVETKLRPATAAVLGGIYIGSLTWLHFHQANAWWSKDRRSFHFEEDWVYALQVDKAGHFYGGYLFSYLLSEGLIGSGFSWDEGTNWGTVLGILYQTYVETEDGFAKDWGFSPSDWYADAAGSLFFIAQHYVPALQNITPKWQYVPSEWTGKPVIERPRTFIDDYNSSTFWWSVNVYNILPQNLKQYWVPWLDFSLGYGADAIDAAVPGSPPDQLASRRYIIGLDYNLVNLLPDGGWFWNWFRQSLNLIKFPSPAIEFQNNITRFHLFYPFRISIGNFKF
ncbi:MAG TPA: DUF2279 domain-containing protein [Ignavibacteriaceae bacterium]|nr:DUF2279 domain-containing protein [Ignavibacteriaceae bacterium]